MNDDKDPFFGEEYEDETIYFEKQVCCQCGIHALNNVVGRSFFSFTDIDPTNIVGNYTIQQLRDVVYKRTKKSLIPIFNGIIISRKKEESPQEFCLRIGILAVDQMRGVYWDTSFLCQRRNHYFALKYIIDTDLFVLIDSTKQSLFCFDDEHWMALGRLLKHVYIYSIK